MSKKTASINENQAVNQYLPNSKEVAFSTTLIQKFYFYVMIDSFDVFINIIVFQ